MGERQGIHARLTQVERDGLYEQQRLALKVNSSFLQQNSVAMLREEIKLILQSYHGELLDYPCRYRITEDVNKATQAWRLKHEEVWRNLDGSFYSGEDLVAYLRYEKGVLRYGENKALSIMAAGHASVIYVTDSPLGKRTIKNTAKVDYLTNTSATTDSDLAYSDHREVYLEMSKGISTVLDDGRIPISFTVNGEINHRIAWLSEYTSLQAGSKVRITIEVLSEGND
jgi:hypothetical protein